MRIEQATCEPLLDPPQRKRRFMIFGSMGVGLTALVGVGMIAGSVIVPRNNKKFDDIAVAALDLAEHRNTCRIKTVRTTTTLGKPAVEVTIDITTGTRPDSKNSQYDGLGVDVTFEDGTGNLQSGILVTNKTHSDEPSSTVLGGQDSDGPDTGTNSITLAEPILTKGKASYEVYRQNTIDTSITGVLVTDKYPAISGLVSCGTLEYEAIPVSSPSN